MLNYVQIVAVIGRSLHFDSLDRYQGNANKNYLILYINVHRPAINTFLLEFLFFSCVLKCRVSVFTISCSLPSFSQKCLANICIDYYIITSENSWCFLYKLMMRYLLPIAVLQLGVSVLHANRFLTTFRNACWLNAHAYVKGGSSGCLQ